MKDLKEFQKLFKVTFPVEAHSMYYITTMMKSPFYAGLGNVVKSFEDYERDCEERGFKSVKSYKLGYALPMMKDYILNSNSYRSLLNATFNGNPRSKDNLRNNDGALLLSIDFKAANYNSLKSFDTEGEMLGSWEELCDDLDIHPTLASSKSFRQYVFGNTNPKRLQKVQHNNINTIVNQLIEKYKYREDSIVLISHDELVIKIDGDLGEAYGKVFIANANVAKIIVDEGISMPTHFKIYRDEGIGAGMSVQTRYEIKGNALQEQYHTLFKVPANKFFKYFKTHILKEDLDKRDLMFMNDGELAIWDEVEDSIVEQSVPEGEITLDEVKRDYPFLLGKLKDEVPGLSEAQRRKIINTFLNTCPACHNAEPGCQCWNDE